MTLFTDPKSATKRIERDELRAKSDALLKRCRYERGNLGADGRYWWRAPDGQVVRWHPYADAQDAIDLFMAKFPDWRMFVEKLPIAEYKMWSVTIRPHGQDGFETDWCFTLAEAICAAIEAALGDPA